MFVTEINIMIFVTLEIADILSFLQNNVSYPNI